MVCPTPHRHPTRVVENPKFCAGTPVLRLTCSVTEAAPVGSCRLSPENSSLPLEVRPQAQQVHVCSRQPSTLRAAGQRVRDSGMRLRPVEAPWAFRMGKRHEVLWLKLVRHADTYA